MPRYPDIQVELLDQDANGALIIGRVRKAMEKAGVPKEVIQTFATEAKSGDYDHLLGTCMDYVDVV